MNSLKDSLAFWAPIIGTLLGFLGLVQSYSWLTGIGALLLVGSFIAILYGRRQRQLVLLAAVKVEGRSIDSLNIAGLRRRLNRTLVIQEASHLAQIDGEDLAITWQYSGYCRADQEAAMEFSIDTDNNIPFDKLDCFAYDLQHDAHRNHKIRPILIGPDGMSKKISVPFLEPLSSQQPFKMLLKCELPGCVKGGLEYCTATMSFEQEQVHRYSIRLVFLRDRPKWLRVYECDNYGRVRLLKDLRPLRENQELSEYTDVAEDVAAKSARIYLFRRAEAIHLSSRPKTHRAA